MTKNQAIDGNYTLNLSMDYGTGVEVEYGQITLVAGWYEFDLDAIVEKAQKTCQMLNFAGALYAPMQYCERKLIATIEQSQFRVTRHDTPVAPYAVYIALPGCLPSRIEHHANLRDALEDFASLLDRALDDLAIPDEDDHELRAFMLSDLETIQAALRAHGDPIHPEHNLKFGFSSHISTYEWLTVAPIQPEDYDPNVEA